MGGKSKARKRKLSHAVPAETNEIRSKISDSKRVDVDSSKNLPSELLSPELREELSVDSYRGEGEEDANSLVLLGPKKKNKKSRKEPKVHISEDVKKSVAKMSKTKERKMRQLQERKEKAARRGELYAKLAESKITDEQMSLMYSSGKLGHKETLRERLKRTMNRKKAGLEVNESDMAELFVTSTVDEISDLCPENESTRNEGRDMSTSENELEAQRSGKNSIKNKKKKGTESLRVKLNLVKSDEQSTNSLSTDECEKTKKRNKKLKALEKVERKINEEKNRESKVNASAASAAVSVETVGGGSSAEVAKQVLSGSTTSTSNKEDAMMAQLRKLREKNERKRVEKEAQNQNKHNSESTSNDSMWGLQSAEDNDKWLVGEKSAYIPVPIRLESAAGLDQREEKEGKSESERTITFDSSFGKTDANLEINRSAEIQAARMKLPICSMEQEIMECIHDNNVVILCGETGSGKTTQVPQFLYEKKYGMKGLIGVTQPRRVAAVSTAKRVAEELNVPFGKNGLVGYQIRYDTENIGSKTVIKYMTDGILLKEVQSDFLLKKYSIILLDEAHERNVNTDILIGLLSRIVPLRAKLAQEQRDKLNDEQRTSSSALAPLKLVIMSATLRVEDFTQNLTLFPNPPPVLRVEARQFPVTIHFNRETELKDYVHAAYRKICKIHRKLPEGGILVFLTGKREILELIRKLQRTFPGSHRSQITTSRKAKQNNTRRNTREDQFVREHDDNEDEADLVDEERFGSEGLEEEHNSSADQEDLDSVAISSSDPIHVLPLYSLLSNENQMKVFQPPPEGHRLIVVSTDVAETSVTIPNMKYVLDAGRCKSRVFDLRTGISEFQIKWVSKASADQRAGRAGRTGPGHCYRLYSSAVYNNDFEQFSKPEIVCQPIEDLVLQMKAMGIHEIAKFPFPTPPEEKALNAALVLLSNLGAIKSGGETITSLGMLLCRFPVASRFAKMLLLGKQNGCLEYAVAIVAALSGHSPFLSKLDLKDEEDKKQENSNEPQNEQHEEDDLVKEWEEAEKLKKQSQWMHATSDVLSMLRAAGAYAYAGASSNFCMENNLHEKIMQQMLQLRGQLTRICNKLFEQVHSNGSIPFKAISVSRSMPPPSLEQEQTLSQILAAGFLDQVAKRVPVGVITEGSRLEKRCAYMSCNPHINEPLYIHPHSHIFTVEVRKLPEYVVYQSVMRTSRAYMKNVSAIKGEWLVHLAKDTPLCSKFSAASNPPPQYNEDKDCMEAHMRMHYGHHNWELPPQRMLYPVLQDQGVYRWFMKSFLEDKVLGGLFEPFEADFVEKPSIITRKKLDKKIQIALLAFVQHDVRSKRALIRNWSRDETFLQAEVLPWIRKQRRKEFITHWLHSIRKFLKESTQPSSV